MYRKLLFIFIIISLATCTFIFRHYFHIFYFQSDLNNIAINIESENKGEIYTCFDKNCDKMKFENGIYSYKLSPLNHLFYKKNYKEIEFLSNKNIEINNPLVFQGMKGFSNDLKINNKKSFIKQIAVYFESIFYNWYFYIAFYVLTLIYVIKYKPKLKLNIALILFLGFILRLSHINFIPLWNDELYSYCVISDNGSGLNLRNIYNDAGNPPLFYLISNIWLLIFNKSLISIRFLPLIIGILGIYSIYYATDKILDKKTALIASFLASINIFMILQANELRSYILSMALIVWNLFIFFKLKNNFSNKNLLFYCILTIFLLNTHYYCILFVIFNFILGEILFKNKIKFLISNLISFITVIPYFLLNYKNSISNSFNTWIESPSPDIINNHIVFYFGNILFFIIVIIFSIFIYKKLTSIQKNVLNYTTGTIVFVFLSALIISIFIKPILFERYFCIFLPYLIINTAIFLSSDLKPFIAVLVFLFSLNIPKYENFNLFYNIDFTVKYAIYDSKKHPSYKKYIIIPDNEKYLKYYPEAIFDKVIIAGYINGKKDLEKEYFSNIKEKTIIYIPECCLNSKIKYSKTLDIKRIDTTIVPIYKVVIE